MNKPTFHISQVFAVALLVTAFAVADITPEKPSEKSPSTAAPVTPVAPQAAAPAVQPPAAKKPAQKALATDKNAPAPAAGQKADQPCGKNIGEKCSDACKSVTDYFACLKSRGWNGMSSQERIGVLAVIGTACAGAVWAVNALYQWSNTDEAATNNIKSCKSCNSCN